MSIQQAPYYWVTCDKCGKREPPEGAEWTAWIDKEQALAFASESDWMLVYTPDGKKLMGIFCPWCWAAAGKDD